MEATTWPPKDDLAEQLSGDFGGLGLREAWVLARDREGWRGFATSRCCSGV